MTDLQYFYLEGKEVKGPYSFEELLKKGLNDNVMVMDKINAQWKPFSTFLHKIDTPCIQLKEKKYNIIFAKSSRKNVILLKLFLILLLLIVVFWGIFYCGYNVIKKNDLESLKMYIDNDILEGNRSIVDGVINLVGSNQDYPIYEINKPNRKTRYIFSNYDVDEYGIDKAINDNAQIKAISEPSVPFLDNSYKDLVLVPFRIVELIKTFNGYDIVEFEAKKIGYINNKYFSIENIPGIQKGGIYENIRLSPIECYKKAFKCFLNEPDLKVIWAKGKIHQIEKLIYKIPNSGRDMFFGSKYHNLMLDDCEMINNIPCTGTNGYTTILNPDWTVYCSHKVTHYKIKEYDNSLYDLMIEIGIILTIVLLIVFCSTLFLLPNFYRNLNLYGKTWISLNNEKALSFEFNIFKKSKIHQLNNFEVLSSKIQFINRRNVFRIVDDKRLAIFRIIEISSGKLIVENLKSNEICDFRYVNTQE